MQFKIRELFIFLALFLISCSKGPYDYAYLMSHPAVLQKVYDRCKMNSFNDSQCDVAQHAMRDFTDLVNKSEQNPIEFGKTILMAQMDLADLQLKMQNTKNVAEPQAAEQTYQKQKQKVETLLAVIGIHSPE